MSEILLFSEVLGTGRFQELPSSSTSTADRNLFAVEHEIGEKGFPNSPAAKVKINMAGRLTARFSVQPRTSFFLEVNRVFLNPFSFSQMLSYVIFSAFS